MKRDDVHKLLALTIVSSMAAVPVNAAESKLLESVKRNPSEALAFCQKFEKMNTKGRSAFSKKTTKRVASLRNLNLVDAEVFVTYVVGMHCPDVR